MGKPDGTTRHNRLKIKRFPQMCRSSPSVAKLRPIWSSGYPAKKTALQHKRLITLYIVVSNGFRFAFAFSEPYTLARSNWNYADSTHPRALASISYILLTTLVNYIATITSTLRCSLTSYLLFSFLFNL